MPVCCRIQLCCDPPEAAADLAEAEGIPLEAAAKILAGYLLVPKTLEPAETAKDTALALAAQQRLRTVGRLVRTELRGILEDLGHAT